MKIKKVGLKSLSAYGNLPLMHSVCPVYFLNLLHFFSVSLLRIHICLFPLHLLGFLLQNKAIFMLTTWNHVLWSGVPMSTVLLKCEIACHWAAALKTTIACIWFLSFQCRTAVKMRLASSCLCHSNLKLRNTQFTWNSEPSNSINDTTCKCILSIGQNKYRNRYTPFSIAAT